ncbi:MAG: hypothetical protein AB7V32_07930 [Candidatus Berkiella sp.]
MSTIVEDKIVSLNVPPDNQGNSIAPQENSSSPMINYFSYFQIYFDAYLQDIYLPLANIVFPYGAISMPFNLALFEYIKEDIEKFEKKLESFLQNQDEGPDFLNVSYDELLNTPVDEGQENVSSNNHQDSNASVQSSENNLNTSNGYGSNGSSLGLYREQTQFVTNTQSSESNTSQSFHIADQFYIMNVNETLTVPSSQSALKDPPEIELGTLFTFGNLNRLLQNLSFAGFISGIEQNNNFGRDNIVQLPHGQLKVSSTDGQFIYNAQTNTPFADEFTFFVSALKGGLVGIGHAYISQIQDQSYYAPVLYDSSNNALSFGINGSLLAGDAAGKGATLSILDVFDPDLGLNGLYIPIDVQNPINFTSTLLLVGASTHIVVQENGMFTFQSNVIDVNNPSAFPDVVSFDFIVGDGHGNGAKATATVTPLITPVVLDLDDVGFNLVAAKDSNITLGQLTNSQNSATIGWIGEGNGILMYDYDNSQQLSNLNQISFISYVKGAQSDLEGLVAFDSNQNQMLDAQDKDYLQFGVIQSDGSYSSLSQLGIVSISLDSQKINLMDEGNVISGLTLYQTQDGNAHLAADAGLSIHTNNTLSLNEILQTPPTVSDVNTVTPLVVANDQIPLQQPEQVLA